MERGIWEEPTNSLKRQPTQKEIEQEVLNMFKQRAKWAQEMCIKMTEKKNEISPQQRVSEVILG